MGARVTAESQPAPDAPLETVALWRIASAGGLVIDAGGGERFTKGLSAYRDWFEGVDYRTLDISSDTGPDLVGDIEGLPFEDASVDAFICRSVLEHVRRPQAAADEMRRCLRPGGQLLLTVPSIYPYHAREGAGGYPDYWRFFESTVRMLLEGFSELEVERVGGPFTAALQFSPAVTRIGARLAPATRRMDRALARRRSLSNVSLLHAWARR